MRVTEEFPDLGTSPGPGALPETRAVMSKRVQANHLSLNQARLTKREIDNQRFCL
jgi:hypothetical protein